MINLSEKEYERLKKRDGVRSPRDGKKLQNDHEINTAYLKALEVLRDLQSVDGDLWIGSRPFRLQVQINHKRANMDDTNIQKGCEDALNKIFYRDDKQNKYLSESPRWAWD